MIRTIFTGDPPNHMYGATCKACGAVIEGDLDDLGETALCPTKGCVEVLYVRIVPAVPDVPRRMVRDIEEKKNV